jgi:hypothetical protein
MIFSCVLCLHRTRAVGYAQASDVDLALSLDDLEDA